MKLFIIIALCGVLALPVAAQTGQRGTKAQTEATKAKPELSITIINEKTPLCSGDSMVVTYRLRSLLPLNRVRMVQAPTLKGAAGWRELLTYSRQHQTTENGKTYYTIDIAYFMVSPKAVSTLTIGEGVFETEVITGQTQSDDPLDFFFGSGVQYTTEKHRIKSPKHTLHAVEAPLRSTQEVLQRGGQLL